MDETKKVSAVDMSVFSQMVQEQTSAIFVMMELPFPRHGDVTQNLADSDLDIIYLGHSVLDSVLMNRLIKLT